MDFANPTNWLTIYEAQTVHVGGAPLPPIAIDGSFDHRYLIVTAGNEYPKPSWQLGAYIDLMIDESTPRTRAYRFESPINQGALLVVPDFLTSYKIRAIAPKWFRCIELKIQGFQQQIPTYSYFGDFIPSSTYTYNLEVGIPLTFLADGNITKLRFYMPDGETGTHTMKIWSDNGDLLVTLPVDNSVIGWNEQALETPFAVLNGETYRISVNANELFSLASGGNPITPNPDSPIQTLNNTNGRYNPNVGNFPDQGDGDGDYYFVDVVFQPT